MAEFAGLQSILDLRNQLRNQDIKQHKLTNNQAYLIAVLVAIVVIILYLYLFKRQARYSTILTIGAITFLIVLDFLDFPDQRWFRTITIIIIGLLIFEIVGYEVMRLLKERNTEITLEKIGL